MEKDVSLYNRMEQSRADFKRDFQKNRKKFLTALVSIFAGTIVLVSWVVQYILYILEKQDKIYVMSLFTAWTRSGISIVVTLLLFGLLVKAAYRFYRLTQKDYIQNDEENYKESKQGTYGDAHWQREDEKAEHFVMSKDIEDVEGDILGIDKKGRIYALRDDLKGINKNKIAFGAAGSGKSAAVVLNDIMQLIRRGESAIVTDSKGDVYRDTAYIAKKHGYIVRVLNLKAKELKNSDAWEPLKYVTEDDEIQAEVLANAIIENTLDGPMDYWANNEMNCLKATILLVATTPAFEGHRSMREVVDIVSNPASFDAKFIGLPDDNPAKNAYNIYSSCKDDVKKQILNGMGIRLGLLSNKYVKEIVSHDEIDLILPMKKKCIYYIIISDTDTTMKFVASMFFTQIFMVQCDYSDSLTKKEKKAQLPVRYELDEFKNIGKIPYFDTKISTFRSRKISSTLILQGITQLQEIYPHKAHNAILANTSTKILLQAGDEETAKLFNTLCGTLTVLVENGKYEKGRTKMLDMHDHQSVSEGLGKRDLLPVDKAMKLNPNTVVICISTQQPIKLNKYICENLHPMFKESREKSPNRHMPKWRKEKIQAEKEQEERFKKLQENAVGGEDSSEDNDKAPKKPQGTAKTGYKPKRGFDSKDPKRGVNNSAGKEPKTKAEQKNEEGISNTEYWNQYMKGKEPGKEPVQTKDTESKPPQVKKENAGESNTMSQKSSSMKPVNANPRERVYEKQKTALTNRLKQDVQEVKQSKGDSILDNLFRED